MQITIQFKFYMIQLECNETENFIMHWLKDKIT